jgi:hypothetical protein
MSEEAPPPGEGEQPLRSIEGGKSKRPISTPVTHEVYEMMAVAYLAGARSVRDIQRRLKAQGVGISKSTAEKAIKFGWVQNKWPPLRERAELHDKLRAAATNGADPKRAKAAHDWLRMRDDYLTIAGGVRANIAQAINIMNRDVKTAVSTQVKPVRQVHFEEVLDAKGRVVRRIPRTLTVDVTMPPSIFDVSAAVNQLAAALERTGGGELGQLMAKPPQGAANRRGHSMTPEQVQWMADHGGAIPPGVTPEQLGDFNVS